jgi:RNA polymerase sigma-70 factor (ECF subfamily)
MAGYGPYGTIEKAIAACGRGDRLALRAIYEAEGPKLLGVALRMLKRRAIAEEVVQDAFLKAWEAAPRFDGTAGQGRGWLVTILRNRALNVLRGEARLDLIEDYEPLALASEEDNAEVIIARLSDESALRRCLQRLDETRRRLIVLAYTEGLSHGEIAARLGAPLGSVKSWIRRSLLSLKECMG